MSDSTGPQSPAFHYEGQDLTPQEREVVLEALRALPVGKPGRQQLIDVFFDRSGRHKEG